ncbi:MAG: LysR family transcriptional regulator [Deltaproteobacteria bacterium]|nr:MAG: LysR family transcriptional regulator [Deltaproteobacteria bacterium]
MGRKKATIDFDLRQLEIFRRVVELKSFSRAAEKVFLAQASVSERIATLERLVGIKLLDRLGRQVVPTKAGELLYKHAVLLLDMKQTAALEMENFLGLKQGTIRMGGSTIPGEYILPGVIGRFHEEFPGISVTISISDTSDIEKRVIEGELELGVVGSRSRNSLLQVRRIWQDELVLAVSKGHPWTAKKEVLPEELANQPLIFRERGSGTLRTTREYLQKVIPGGTDGLNVVARFGSSTAVKEGIKAGVGISIISARAIKTELDAGLLKALKIKELCMLRSFYLIRDKRRIASPSCQAMLDFLTHEDETGQDNHE